MANEPCILLPMALEPVDEISKGRVSVELNPSAAMGLTLVRVAVVAMTGERLIDKDIDQRIFLFQGTAPLELTDRCGICLQF